jgi:hypothetical protein
MSKMFTLEQFKTWGGKGGKARTKKKTEAVRENGRKGGRPKKVPAKNKEK